MPGVAERLSRQIRIRPFQPSDLEPITALWNRSLEKDPITSERFWRLILLDPNFSPDAALVAESDGKPVGFLHSVTQNLDQPIGRITAFLVAAEYRRRGIGRRLIESGLDHLRRAGCDTVTCNGYAPYYFFPGIDHDYEDALLFMESMGFFPLAEAVAMTLDFAQFRLPTNFDESNENLAREGYSVRQFELKDTVSLLRFAEESFPYWRQSLVESLQVDRRNVFVALKGHDVVGTAQWENPETDPPKGVKGRFGPFGVQPDLRGKGIGMLLFEKVSKELRARGIERLWFGWAGGRNLSFYERAGCQITRRFRLLTRSL